MRDYFSFLGFTFIAFLLFGIVNNIHLAQEKERPGSFLERASFVLMLPLGLFSLPALILSFPVLKNFSTHIKMLHEDEISKKYANLHSITQHQLKQAEEEINILKFRLQKYEEANNPLNALCKSIKDLLHLNHDQYAALLEFSGVFEESATTDSQLTINSIDIFIDWMYMQGFIIPSLDQYKALGLVNVSSRRIYVPESVRTSIEDWKSFRENALNAGLLLTTNNSAPTIEAWNSELAYYLEGYFSNDSAEFDALTVLERIVDIADEGYYEHSNLLEYIARIAELPHESETNQLHNFDSQLEKMIRSYAAQINVRVEDPPSDFKGKIRRISAQVDRFAVVHNWRKQHLLQ